LSSMKTAEFDYNLPQELIAQEPLKKRDRSRLLILNRKDASIKEGLFKDIIDCFSEGDVLVLNKTKVIPARLWANKKTGAKIEVLLLQEQDKGIWQVLIKPSKRIRISDQVLFFQTEYKAEVLERSPAGKWLIRFYPEDIRKLIYTKGIMPTPPYIKKKLKDHQDYQTVFAECEGSVACPTAGLHFTKQLLLEIKSRGVKIVYITLHVGLATFRPIKAEDIEDHKMDSEYFEISKEDEILINRAKAEKKRIFACGTSAVRALESQAYSGEDSGFKVKAKSGWTNLFIYPGFKFKIADCLITNFHLPRSTNFLLASAFAEKDLLLKTYKYAVQNKFRFYSFGDAMLIL